jgi:hypothetical protein
MDCLSSEDLKEERRKLTHPLRYADRIGLSTRWLATISGEKGELEGRTNSTWVAQGSSLALAYKIGLTAQVCQLIDANSELPTSVVISKSPLAQPSNGGFLRHEQKRSSRTGQY